MLLHYFKLQFNIINRKLIDFGLSLFLGYPLIIFFFFFISSYLFTNIEQAQYLYSFIPLFYSLKLSDKERNTFLKHTYSKKKYFLIRILENSVVSLPFCIFLIFKGYFIESSLTLFFSILIILVETKKTKSIVLPTPFSKQPFEFCIGFRKTFLAYPILIAISLLSIKANNLNLGIASICGNILLAATFYLKPENPYFVWIYNQKPNTFLNNKLIRGFKNAIILSLPNLILICFYFNQNLNEIGLFYFLGLFFFCTIILMKYAYFI